VSIAICPECRAGKCQVCAREALDFDTDEIVPCACPHGGMSEEEQLLAKQIYTAMMDYSNHSGRSKQSQDFVMGISEVGYCAERTRRMLDHQIPEPTDVLAAFIGTAVGDHVEKAILEHLWPHALIQQEVFLNFRLQGQSFRLPGHPDVLLPDWGVLDVKTDFGLADVERSGPSFSQQFQRHGYALAAFESGVFGDMALDDVMVGNVWIDRGAVDKRVHVQVERFDQSIIDEGLEWLDSTVYAYKQGEEAMKQPPRDVCRVTCGFFAKCREWETDVHGLLEGREALALDRYAHGAALASEGERLKKEAKAHLEGVSGSNGRLTIRHT